VDDKWYILIVGNPIDGLSVIGPFELHDDAINYGETFGQGEDWWVTGMSNPVCLGRKKD
jgi:hypothetical protein